MLREFRDTKGMTWRVWDVYPTTRGPTHASGAAEPQDKAVLFPNNQLSDGWLCFESENEKRRLAPIPAEWETCESCVLEELCLKAGFATRFTPPRDAPPMS